MHCLTYIELIVERVDDLLCLPVAEYPDLLAVTFGTSKLLSVERIRFVGSDPY